MAGSVHTYPRGPRSRPKDRLAEARSVLLGRSLYVATPRLGQERSWWSWASVPLGGRERKGTDHQSKRQGTGARLLDRFPSTEVTRLDKDEEYRRNCHRLSRRVT
jgi:hypothetical protein